MSTIGERVKYAIDHMNRGETYAALEHACNALDVTSQRHYHAKQSGRKNFKALIREYSWLVESMSLGGVNLDETKFDNFPLIKDKERNTILNPDFSDLMYHVVRCDLIHSVSLYDGFSFHDKPTLEMSHKKITFPNSVVWALLAISIFCKCNKGESIPPSYWIGFYNHRLVIQDFWGNEIMARFLANQYPIPRVTFTNLSTL